MKNILICLIFIFVSVACDPECEPLTSRCYENTVEICDMEGDWQTAADCDALGIDVDIEFKCCSLFPEYYNDSIHMCCPVGHWVL